MSKSSKASLRSFPSESHTMTKRIATGGHLGVYHKAVHEKTQSFLIWPPYDSTSTVSQGVSERFDQPCKLRCRLPSVGLGPRLPGDGGSGQ